MHDGIDTLLDFVVESIGNPSTHPLTSIVVVHFNNPPRPPHLFFVLCKTLTTKGPLMTTKTLGICKLPMMVITPGRSTKRSMELEASSSHLSTCIACPYNG